MAMTTINFHSDFVWTSVIALSADVAKPLVDGEAQTPLPRDIV
jgi:hypothetical protein